MPRTKKSVVQVPEDLKGRVIGKKGCELKKIERETGVKMSMQLQGALLEGSEEAVEKAKGMIQSIISSCQQMPQKTVRFPLEFNGLVIGKNGATIELIKKQTNTKIQLERGDDPTLAYIKGATEEQCNAAEQMILEVVSKHVYGRRFKKLAFAIVDGACVGEDNEFELEECRDEFELEECRDDSNKLMYKLIMQGDKLDEPKEVHYLPKLEKSLLEVLHEIYKKNQEGKNRSTDMFCSFGHAYICNVDEADVGEIYQIEDVNKNLQKQEGKWKVEFKEDLENTELVDLEGILSKEPYKVEPYTRFDYRFSYPSGREVRFKAFSVNSSSDPDGVSFTKYKPPIPMKNELAVESTESIKYYLCAPYTHRLKVDICFPYLTLDCHLVVRTTLKETSTVRDEEEDKILIDFLNDNLNLKEGKLELQEDLLPDGFAVNYFRECKRRTYTYKHDNVDFNVTISEEKSRQRATETHIRTKTCVCLYCDVWDKLLDQEEWEPEAIVSKLPDFLNFVRAVQSNINP